MDFPYPMALSFTCGRERPNVLRSFSAAPAIVLQASMTASATMFVNCGLCFMICFPLKIRTAQEFLAPLFAATVGTPQGKSGITVLRRGMAAIREHGAG